MVININSFTSAAWKNKSISLHNKRNKSLKKDVFLDMKTLGTGGQGTVYLHQNSDGNLYAAKAFKNDSDLKRELDNYKKISEMHNGKIETHPNIAQCFGEKKINEKNHLLTEFIDGEDLNTFISNCDSFCKKLPKDTKFISELRLILAQQLISALNYLEEKGLSNADIKPENIMINKNGELKIIDFGLQQERNSPAKSIGTHHYMAPEILLAKSNFQKTDSYSAGNTLLNILTGLYINQNYQELNHHAENTYLEKVFQQQYIGGKFTLGIFDPSVESKGKEIEVKHLSASGHFFESRPIEDRLKNEVIAPLLKLDPKDRAEIKDVFKIIENIAAEYLTTENKEQAINLFKTISSYKNDPYESQWNTSNIKNSIAAYAQKKIQASGNDENNHQRSSSQHQR